MAPLHLRVVRAPGDSRPPGRGRARTASVSAPRGRGSGSFRPARRARRRRRGRTAAILFVLTLGAAILAFAGIAGLPQSVGWGFAVLAGLFSLAGPSRRTPPPRQFDSAP